MAGAGATGVAVGVDEAADDLAGATMIKTLVPATEVLARERCLARRELRLEY
jgi:hypothetical protein